MMSRSRSSIKNPSTTCLVVKKSAAAPKPAATATGPAAPARPQLPVSGHNLQSQPPFGKQNKPTIILEYPVSPEVDVQGEGVANSNHPVPHHKLMELNRPNPFVCAGCKEYGAGTRFSCQQCNFELHNFCALAPPILKSHPLHSQHQLVFYTKPTGKGGLLRSKCDVCGKPRKGYMFQCGACSFELHPCCAMLGSKMKFPNHPHPLIMMPGNVLSEYATADSSSSLCAECKRKRSGQVYRCTAGCDYYLHAVCAKNFVNGLQANGIKGLLDDKPNMLGIAAKLASQVVVGFVGGIFEGIGEGLGEALTQNFAKGKCNSTKKPTSSSTTSP